MNRTAYRIHLTAPGLAAGHRFDIPADLVPTNDATTVLEALSSASAIAEASLILRVQPVYEGKRHPERETARRPRQRLRSALTDFLASCTDPAARRHAEALKTRLI